MIERDLAKDGATQHRVAGVFGLAFAAAAVTSLAGVFGAIALDVLPDATWPAKWLPVAVSAAEQQNAAAQQWMNIILIFGAITAVIACVNALIGFISHANERRYETALRGLIGASPSQLRRSLRRDALTNGLLGAGAGITTGLALAFVLRRMWDSDSALAPAWPLFALALTFTVAAFAARMAGNRFRRKGWMGDALAPEARTIPGFGAEDLRAVLTACQLACAVALTIVSLLVWSYASTATSANSLARADRYVTRAHGSHQQVRAAIRTAQIHAESIASPGALLGIGKIDRVVSECGRCIRANMYTPLFTVETQHHVAGAGFFEVAGVPVVEGREFKDADEEARTVVVNRTFSRLAFQGQDAVGKRILVGGFEKGQWYKVLGVVEDIPIEGPQFLESNVNLVGAALPGYAPAIYFSANEHPPTEFDVIVQAAHKPVLAGFAFEPVSRMIARARAPQQAFSRVLTVLGLLLCGATVLGAFTATMLSVRARRFEISIRRAVGARRSDVLRLVYGRVIGVTLRGVAVGAVVSIALTRAIEVFVPGLPMFDMRIALGVCAAIFVIAILATVIPLRAALRISPAQAHE